MSLPRLAPILLVVANLAFAAAAGAEPSQSSTATITGKFGDSCRDFAARSTKDISHVEIHYSDGRVAKDETIIAPDHAIDGRVGEELDLVVVKSGTTTETFPCPRSSSPPTAVLEVKAPSGCFTWPDGLVDCDGRLARTTWVQSTVPSVGFGLVRFFCDSAFSDPSCVDHEMPCGELDFYTLCRITYTFRGTSSTDPDNDIVSWSIDFGDGTSASGDWATNPPTEVPHEYLIHHCPTCSRMPATFTVTDSAGNTHSNAQFAFHQYPD
jgi:hypothetical protein